MAPLRATILHLGRRCDGEIKRVAAWVQVLEALDFDVTLVPLLHQHRRSTISRATLGTGVTPYVPESRLWDERSLMKFLHSTQPDYVVGVTSRCWTTRLNEGNWKLLLDFVDTMSVNYQIRSKLSGVLQKPLFRFLSQAHRRIEQSCRSDFPDALFFHAGHREAARQNSLWFPNLASPMTERSGTTRQPPTYDLVFFGALYTPINVDGIRSLDYAHRVLLPQTKVLIAGRNPTKEVVQLCDNNGWTLAANFPDIGWLAGQARVAVAPLGPSTGIQNKVLDSAVAGIPQTLTNSVRSGFGPDFPVAGSNSSFSAISEAVQLAGETDATRSNLAQATRQYVLDRYGLPRWAKTLADRLALDHTKVNLNQPTGRFEPLIFLDRTCSK